MRKERRSTHTVGERSDGGDLLERVLDAAPAAEPAPLGSARMVTGLLAGVDRDGGLLFRPDGWTDAPFAVEIGTSHSDAELVEAARTHRRAVVAVPEGAPPVLVSLVRARVLSPAPDEASPAPLDVVVDGKTVTMQASEQIELRCGKSSLLLHADGRVVLSGTYVVSTSRGPNKIRGATVTLN
jgi:hypothetical protein